MVKRVVLVSAVLVSLLITPLTVGPRHRLVADAVFPPVEQTVVT